MGSETIVSLNLESTDLTILNDLADKANKTAEVYLVDLIREKANPTLENCKAIVNTLELVWNQLNDNDSSMSALRTEIASDLIVARCALEIQKNGKAEPELVKKWALELFT